MKNWNNYFLKVCETVASNSKCRSIQRGAILVRDHSIISTGYNGPPRGVPHCGKDRIELDNYLRQKICKTYDNYFPTEDENKCPRQRMGFKSGDGLDYCIAAHAEQNCIVNAARMGVTTLNSTLYTDSEIPCKNCLVLLINAGIKEIFVKDLKLYDPQSEYIIKYSELSIRKFLKSE